MPRVSNSFREDEVSVLCDIIDKLTCGADARILLRSPSFSSAAAKLYKMRERSRRPVVLRLPPPPLVPEDLKVLATMPPGSEEEVE